MNSVTQAQVIQIIGEPPQPGPWEHLHDLLYAGEVARAVGASDGVYARQVREAADDAWQAAVEAFARHSGVRVCCEVAQDAHGDRACSDCEDGL